MKTLPHYSIHKDVVTYKQFDIIQEINEQCNELTNFQKRVFYKTFIVKRFTNKEIISFNLPMINLGKLQEIIEKFINKGK